MRRVGVQNQREHHTILTKYEALHPTGRFRKNFEKIEISVCGFRTEATALLAYI